MGGDSSGTRRIDWLIAVALAAILSAAWSAQHWADLAQLRLPDTDDAMRLQQVRDWLAGQAWSDLRQYRLGPPGGLAMHWSRLADLPVAAIIFALRPLLGQASAELVAIILWPAALFAAQLALIAAITRRLAGNAAAPVAMLVAALAYPAISLFMPGRIDHHALQLVVLTACAHGMIAPPSRLRGFAIGAAMVASLAIGFELLPLIAVIGGWALLAWLRGGHSDRLAGIGAGLAVIGLFAGGVIPASSPANLCDALNPVLRGAVVVGGLALLAMATLADKLVSAHRRWWSVALVAVPILIALARAPACLAGPYGAVDPMLARLWLGNVAEAQSVVAASPAIAFGYVGLALAGLTATLWQARRTGGGWWGVVGLIATSLAIACIQLRGAYAGAALAAPAMAATIVAARARGPLALAAAWLASAGILYPIVASALIPVSNTGKPSVACATPATLAALRTLPPGRIVAPIDIGAFAVSGSGHASLAAPYHRNNAGNRAMYVFFLGPEAGARAIAARDRLTYVAWCDGAFDEIDLVRDAASDALIHRLRAGTAPAWLQPSLAGPLKVWRIDPRLPERAPPH